MDYEKAVKKYIELRTENTRIEAEANEKIAANKATMEKLGVWIELKAEKDKLEKVNTNDGTVFWTIGSRCNLTNSEEFFSFVQEKEAWELIEKRASKTGVADWINTHKVAPPGVNYATFKQINVRKS